MQFIDDKIGYVAANNGQIYLTENGGNTWQLNMIDGMGSNLSKIFFLNTNLEFCSKNANLVYKFENSEWKLYDFPNKDAQLTHLQFFTNSIWFVCTNQGNDEFSYILKTENSGETWDTLSLAYKTNYTKITMLDELTGIAIGNGENKIFVNKTIDGV